MRQGPSEPTHRNTLHPNPDERDGIAAGVNTVIAMGEGKSDVADPAGEQTIADKGQEVPQPPIAAASLRRS
jgi:hypothetical protein